MKMFLNYLLLHFRQSYLSSLANRPTAKEKPVFHLFLLLESSASRGMRQIFSCLSKLGGATNLIRLLFGHFKLVFLGVWRIFVNLTVFFVITKLKIVAVIFRKMEKMPFDEI